MVSLCEIIGPLIDILQEIVARRLKIRVCTYGFASINTCGVVARWRNFKNDFVRCQLNTCGLLIDVNGIESFFH